jgi:hypothetical protein
VKTILTLLCATMALASCQTSTVVKDIHMRSDTAYGPSVMAYYALFTSLSVQPYYSTTVGYGFKTRYVGPGKSLISEAWSYGKQLPFTKGLSTRIPCYIRPCAPTREDTGMVTMDEADFVAAASKGFEFELAGKAGKIVGSIPAHAFRRVLDLKSGMKLPDVPPNRAALAKPGNPAKEEENTEDDE